MTARLLERRMATAAGATLVAAPVVVAAVRAVARGWYPLGDNALYALRARDVLGANHPLLGTWSSASLSSGTDVNHPGPLLFDLLAIPARIDPIRGVPVGVAVLQVLVIAGIAWAARRRGPGALWATMGVAAMLVWTLGSEMVIDPWQPNVLVLPFFLLLVLVWGVACRDLALLPVAVAVGSFIVQTHLSYVVLVPGLVVWGLAAACRRRSGSATTGAPVEVRVTGRWVLISVAVGCLLWAQPVLEQLAGPGTGNLGRLATTRGGEEAKAGPLLAARLVAGVEVVPPFWLRPSYGDTYSVPLEGPQPSPAEAAASGLPATRTALVGLLAAGLVLLGAGAASWRRRRPDEVAIVGTAAVLGGLVLATASIQPFNPALGLGGHQLAWLWPAGAFGLLAVGVTLVSAWPRVRGVGVVTAVVFSVLALPYANAEVGPRRYDEAAPTMEALGRQLAALGDGPYLVDLSNLYFGEPYSTPMMLELERHGTEVRVDEPGLVRQLGTGRRFTGEAAGRLYLRIGPSARAAAPAGHRRVAFVESLRAAERAELSRLVDEVRSAVKRRGVVMNDAGRRAEADGDLPVLSAEGAKAAEPLVASGELVVLVREGYLVAGPDGPLLRRWADLQHRVDSLTVGIFLGPLDEPIPAPR